VGACRIHNKTTGLRKAHWDRKGRGGGGGGKDRGPQIGYPSGGREINNATCGETLRKGAYAVLEMYFHRAVGGGGGTLNGRRTLWFLGSRVSGPGKKNKRLRFGPATLLG